MNYHRAEGRRAFWPLISAVLLIFVSGGWAADAASLNGKLLFGYQGWFGCPGPWGGNWRHWAGGNPTPDNLSIEMFPDLREFAADDLCPADNFTVGGETARLFSSENRNIVLKHFEWMRTYGLDGVLAQRFVGEIDWKRRNGDIVLRNVMAGAEQYGRVFALEWDMSGQAGYVDMVKNDWMYLVDSLDLPNAPGYLHEGGLPVVSIWGPGLNSHDPENPDEAMRLIDWFHSGAPEKYRAFYMGGTPSDFRTSKGDSRTDSAWLDVFKAMDAVQPWHVGRYGDLGAVNGWWKDKVGADYTWLEDAGVMYQPVIFPGFSWFNLHDGPKNQIPRLAGRFIWAQALHAIRSGAPTVKIAMFDEVDEGTAMFKIAETQADVPEQGYWLPLDADGEALPSDWYLRVAGCATAALHGKADLTDDIPIQPDKEWIDSTTCWSESTVDERESRAPVRNVSIVWNGGALVFGGLIGVKSLTVLSIRGYAVTIRKNPGEQYIWNRAGLPESGVYILRIETPEGIFTKKFVKPESGFSPR